MREYRKTRGSIQSGAVIMPKKYFFSITIQGFTEDKESVEKLRNNLMGELWHENCEIYPPKFYEVRG